LTLQMVETGLAPLTVNYVFIREDSELTVEAIVDATDGGNNVGATHNELLYLLLWRILNLLWRQLLTPQMVGTELMPLTMNYLFIKEDF
jgi:hypothetical protein